jgi:1-acyl-sn-glycerol-3-phosphate acyltransferase
MAQEKQQKIDIDQIFRAKAGKKAKYVPKFLISWLKRTLHQDEVNRFLLGRAAGKYGVDFLDECVKYLKLDVTVKGMEHLPDNADGRYFTFASNHPLGGADGLVMGKVLCHRYDSKVIYLVNDILMNMKGLAPLCVPVNKTGGQSRNTPKLVSDAFHSDNNILLFPAGLCSRKIKGVIKDLPWKKTFITKSVETHRDIIPVRFTGANSNRFYRIANWSKALRLKFNVAMIFLVDEMFKNMGKPMTVTFGEPIPWQAFDKSRSPQEWAQWVQDKVYEL